jgi:hypothetical protein
VVRVAVDAPIEMDRPDALPAEPADLERLAALGDRWGVGSSIERLCTALLKNAR